MINIEGRVAVLEAIVEMLLAEKAAADGDAMNWLERAKMLAVTKLRTRSGLGGRFQVGQRADGDVWLERLFAGAKSDVDEMPRIS
jgi:hypothetical protein